MKSKVPIYIDNDDARKNLYISTDIDVGPNEPMLNGVINRNTEKLLENDRSIYELYKKILSQLHIHDWSKNDTYNVGDLVWYLYDGIKLFLLKCTIPNNDQVPDISDADNVSQSRLQASGWENMNQYMTVIDYGIDALLSAKVQQTIHIH